MRQEVNPVAEASKEPLPKPRYLRLCAETSCKPKVLNDVTAGRIISDVEHLRALVLLIADCLCAERGVQ